MELSTSCGCIAVRCECAVRGGVRGGVSGGVRGGGSHWPLGGTAASAECVARGAGRSREAVRSGQRAVPSAGRHFPHAVGPLS